MSAIPFGYFFFSLVTDTLCIFTGHVCGGESNNSVSGISTTGHGPQGLLPSESSTVNTVSCLVFEYS